MQRRAIYKRRAILLAALLIYSGRFFLCFRTMLKEGGDGVDAGPDSRFNRFNNRQTTTGGGVLRL